MYFEKYIAEHPPKKPKNNTKKPEIPVIPPEVIFLERLKDNKWLCTLAYLADIFGALNEINLQTQGQQMNCFVFWNRIEAFSKKLLMWQKQIKKLDFTPFSFTNDLLQEDETLADYIQPIILGHLEKLISEFKRYFPATKDPRASCLWVENPFLNVNEPNTLSTAEKEQLIGNLNLNKIQMEFSFEMLTDQIYFVFSFFLSIDLTSDRTLRNSFGTLDLDEFWLKIQPRYSLLSDIAIDKLLAFSTTYRCEAGFSNMTLIKTKYRNRLDAHDAMVLAISEIEPRFHDLSKHVHSQSKKFT